MISNVVRHCFIPGAKAVESASEQINKLNVFPVPDGDTGTNMSLTLNTVVDEINKLPETATMQELAEAIIHGSLMGARGNSGVITSQILRGVAEGLSAIKTETLSTSQLAEVMRHAKKVAYNAVRKPVEGTILTVISDVSANADLCAKKNMNLQETFASMVVAAYDSVSRTPELLVVLKENGVVDSGAYGFAVFFEGFVNAYLGIDDTSNYAEMFASETSKGAVADNVHIELNDDWEGSKYRYCTEFLFHAKNKRFNSDKTLEFLASMGDCELLVGEFPNYKIHVHSNEPDKVLNYMLTRGQIFEVFIHNMDLEAADRTAKIAEDKKDEPLKERGFVAVAPGSGESDILKSLGVNVVVSGGQTMNPSTADILAAIDEVHAKEVVVLPNNGNVLLASEAAAKSADALVAIVPTKSVPEAFAAMCMNDASLDLKSLRDEMIEAASAVRTGEVTSAVRDSQAADGAPIKSGDVMGIANGEILEVGTSVSDVTLNLISKMLSAKDGDMLTVLAGEDLGNDEFDELVQKIEDNFQDLDVDAHRGEQPLYPVIFSIE